MADDVDLTSLINALMARQRPRVPFSGAIDALGQPLDKPEPVPQGPSSSPGWLRDIQPYPIDPRAALEGAVMSSGMTGGPSGAVSSALGHLKDAAVASPLVRALALGGGVLGTSGSTPAESQTPSSLDKLLAQQAEITKQRAAAVADRDAQANGKNGAKAGRGPQYDKAVADIARLDEQAAQLAPVLKAEQERIAREQYNSSPEGKLEAEKNRKLFEDQQAAKERGKPVRENLPPWLQDAVIPASTLAGVLLTRHLTGKANTEYKAATDAYVAAQKTGDVAGMALAKAQLSQLENPGWMEKAKTLGSALLPAEVRGMETGIDLLKPNDSRAHQEANERIHDPWAVGRDLLTTGASSLFAYGLGSKLASPRADRSLGKAIISDPYADAPAIAGDYGTALKLSEDLRRLHQSGADAQARPAIAGPPLAEVLSGEVLPPQGQLPPPAANRLVDKMQAGKTIAPPEGQLPVDVGSSNPVADALVGAPVANKNSVPAGVPKGHAWDDRMKGSKVRAPDGTLAPMPKNLKDTE